MNQVSQAMRKKTIHETMPVTGWPSGLEVCGLPFLSLLWSFIPKDGLTPQSTSVISSDVVQVFLLVSSDTFFINQLPDEFEADIIPDYWGQISGSNSSTTLLCSPASRFITAL